MKKQYTQPELEIRRLVAMECIAGPSMDNETDVGPGGDLGGEYEVGGQIG